MPLKFISILIAIVIIFILLYFWISTRDDTNSAFTKSDNNSNLQKTGTNCCTGNDVQWFPPYELSAEGLCNRVHSAEENLDNNKNKQKLRADMGDKMYMYTSNKAMNMIDAYNNPVRAEQLSTRVQSPHQHAASIHSGCTSNKIIWYQADDGKYYPIDQIPTKAGQDREAMDYDIYKMFAGYDKRFISKEVPDNVALSSGDMNIDFPGDFKNILDD